MKFNDYRNDSHDLPIIVESYLRETEVSFEDQEDVWAFLEPLRTKGEGGKFHYYHCLRVGLLSREIARALNKSVGESERCGHARFQNERAALLAGLLHDIGKALVPKDTLEATCAWTQNDQIHMERHVDDGYRLLRDRFDFTAEVIVRHHRMQVNSYPAQLPEPLHRYKPETENSVENIAKILVIADIYDALHRINSGTNGTAISSEKIKTKLKMSAPVKDFTIDFLYGEGILK